MQDERWREGRQRLLKRPSEAISRAHNLDSYSMGVGSTASFHLASLLELRCRQLRFSSVEDAMPITPVLLYVLLAL